MLIVDDDPAVSRLYAEAIGAAGLRVAVEREVAGALEAVRSGGVEFVVVDALLAHGTGFELAEQIRRLPAARELPILFISGVYKAAKHRSDVIEQLGALDFLEKPVLPDELVAIVRRTIGPEVFAPASPTPAWVSGIPSPRGDLSQRPFHEVLCEHVRLRHTGQLAVRRDKVKKIISLRDGELAGVKSNLLSECLGRMLVAFGQITDAQCAESLERMRETGRLQGACLVAAGLLDARGLDEALAQQIEHKLLDVFTWDAGEWTFTPRSLDALPVIATARPAARVVAEGLARALRPERLSQLLGRVEGLAPRASAAARRVFQPTDPSDGAAQIVDACDGTHTVQELLSAHTLGPAPTYALLVALRELGLVTFAAPDAREGAPILLDRAVPLPVPLGPVVDPSDPLAETKLRRRLEELVRVTHYAALGVPRAASAGEIRRAYVSLAREHHPDKHFQNVPPALREIAERIFDRVTQAHEVLGDAAERARYDESHPESPADRFERVLRADEAYRAGRSAFEGGRYEEAAGCLREARELYREEPLFAVWLALAEWQARPDLPGASERALAAFQAVQAAAPRLREAHLFAAHVRRMEGDAPSGPHDTPARGLPLPAERG